MTGSISLLMLACVFGMAGEYVAACITLLVLAILTACVIIGYIRAGVPILRDRPLK